jgi:hypothetical protein
VGASVAVTARSKAEKKYAKANARKILTASAGEARVGVIKVSGAQGPNFNALK